MKKHIAAVTLFAASLAAQAAPVELAGYRTWHGNLTGYNTSGATAVQVYDSTRQVMPLTVCAKDAPCKIDLPIGKQELAICTERVETCKNFTIDVKPQGTRIVYTETSGGTMSPVILNPLTGPALVAFNARGTE